MENFWSMGSDNDLLRRRFNRIVTSSIQIRSVHFIVNYWNGMWSKFSLFGIVNPIASNNPASIGYHKVRLRKVTSLTHLPFTEQQCFGCGSKKLTGNPMFVEKPIGRFPGWIDLLVRSQSRVDMFAESDWCRKCAFPACLSHAYWSVKEASSHKQRTWSFLIPNSFNRLFS